MGFADGIGGAGLGTAATGDLGERHQFETLLQIRAQVRELEAAYDARHPDKPLSGRLIHVSHYIPFVIRALAEVDYEQKQQERALATDSVAAMAAAARKKRAAREAEKAREEMLASGELHAQQLASDAQRFKRSTSMAAAAAAGASGAAANLRLSMALNGLEGQDMEARLAENQARSQMRAGRRAWMMTPVIDDDDDGDEDGDEDGDVDAEYGAEGNLKDRFTPVSSRRPSHVSLGGNSSRASSFGAGPSGLSAGNIFPPAQEPESNSWTPPDATSLLAAQRPDPVQWVLTPRRGHTALNSGVRSLCKTHHQTFIGWPGDMVYPAQARSDNRTDPSQATDGERSEIEKLLADLDDPTNWAAHTAPVVGAPKDGSGHEPISRVPTPLMNGAEPLSANRKSFASSTNFSGGAAAKSNASIPGAGGASASQRAPAKGKKSVDHTIDCADAVAGEASSDDGQDKGIKYVPVWLDYDTAHGHYEGYCKTVLWPLLHYLVWQDVQTERNASTWDDTNTWAAYVRANEAFAKRIADEYKPGDMVIVHDYHLLLVPKMLRQLVPDAHIALFMHAPFPSSEVFRCLPKRREVIEGMLGADLACFQAFSYSRHFLSSCIRVCGFDASYNSVESYNGHITSISYNPIGIDAEKIAKDSMAPGVKPKIEVIKKMYEGKKIIVGRDKLDIVRGVLQKLQAFQKLLEEFPEWRGKVVLIQVTAPAIHDSPQLERKVSELVSHINSEFGSLSFTPVHHYHQIIERDEYFALLCVADLALITSVRDGMNTTSMEFIICQEQLKKSPLILSEFTGTAGRMRSAIQVNPWNVWGVAKAIDYGLRLSQDERLCRHRQLYDQVTLHTSQTWAATLVKQLAYRLISAEAAHFTPPLDGNSVQQQFKTAGKRLFLLDYDGTLTPIVKRPEDALPSKDLLDALEKLSNDPKNIIYIISGRDQSFLSKHLGHLRNIGFSAEHGCFVKEPGTDEWQNLTLELDMSWMQDIRSMFEYYTERTSGSTIEQKKSSITWHYRNSDPDYGSFQAKECQAHLENLTATNNLAIEVLVGKKNLEVRPLAVNKGEIVKRILWDNTDGEFVLCAGDDKTDEDMFRALVNLGKGSNGDSPLLSATMTTSSSSGTITAKPSNPAVDQLKKKSQEESLLVMSPPTPLNSATPMGSPRIMKLRPEAIFATTVGPSSKKTLAHWHVDSPHRVIGTLQGLAGLSCS
ncbi:glycosyltransferase family 20 protein [Tilletiaria anomala UBC 951]|uniref:Glycosyltransferase family 20 protein n=1 Tax=Tilletiaria anomala (strain ATCC 24038 / CBS 436.72 / UBC 951) TaxID=1037660 RepID=A0A066WNQ5_TILAU|nr:glycosyltransferase family 20 protein [Tilletiaria anomala UBC 951]KDN52245.1 glycosyltransferase family 20 protein [Tilletiaria anomala UBC 951]